MITHIRYLYTPETSQPLLEHQTRLQSGSQGTLADQRVFDQGMGMSTAALLLSCKTVPLIK